MGEEKKPKPMRLGEAVSRGIIANETLAYFIGRTWLFFKKVNPPTIRCDVTVRIGVPICCYCRVYYVVCT